MFILILGVLAILQFFIIFWFEVMWLIELTSTCDSIVTCQVFAKNLPTVACLGACSRLAFQLFLEKGVLPFLENEVRMFVEQKSERQMRIVLLLLMILANVLSPLFLSLACWRFWGVLTTFLCSVFVVVWIVVSLLEGQMYKSSLQLKIIRPRARPKSARQIMRICIERCCRLTSRDVLVVALTIILSFMIGYLMSEFIEAMNFQKIKALGCALIGVG